MTSERVASALLWWTESGVDTIVGEEPHRWLDQRPAPVPPQMRETASPVPPVAPAWPAMPAMPAKSSMPDTLDAFQAWLLESPDLPFASPGAPRIGPSGDPAADLMIMVDMPSTEDLAAGALLTGEAGVLFDRMLAAIGQSRESLYLAPLSPVRTPTGMIDPQYAARLAEIARRHVSLAAPKALLLFGDTCAKALTGGAVAQRRGGWLEFATPAGAVRTLVTIRPEKLLRQPALKTLAWADLQLLKEALKP